MGRASSASADVHLSVTYEVYRLKLSAGVASKELRQDAYEPQPVRRVRIPKVGKPGEYRGLGVPTIYDRVCQQALLQRLEPTAEERRVGNCVTSGGGT